MVRRDETGHRQTLDRRHPHILRLVPAENSHPFASLTRRQAPPPPALGATAVQYLDWTCVIAAAVICITGQKRLGAWLTRRRRTDDLKSALLCAVKLDTPRSTLNQKCTDARPRLNSIQLNVSPVRRSLRGAVHTNKCIGLSAYVRCVYTRFLQYFLTF